MLFNISFYLHWDGGSMTNSVRLFLLGFSIGVKEQR
jgi:hypothetical protein